MKKYCALMAFMVFTFFAVAQKSHDRHTYDEQYESSKIAYITTKLDLSPEEAKVFWPVYNDYEEEKDKLWQTVKRMNSSEMAKMTEKESMDYLDGMIQYDTRKLELKQSFINNMKSILPPRKLAMLFVVEREFRKELFTQMKIRRPEK